ncbi:hypothetical protein [Streptomyces jumonjinensis]|uniref:Uncharacterized protein n=1 Tax=Streptomyces jumonjinensis TaxID=1945 RepID=A0A646KNP3_STRJU|nr:hypothetical protein [Streptomyces jumonjinensis]MQT03863.1 hypothetical protein [Streptomyces jumonjinensis]
MTTDLGISASVLQSRPQDLTVSEDRLAFRRAVHLADGVTAGRADEVFHDRRSIAASGSEDLDLVGVLTDAFGGTVALARVKGIFISAAATNTNNVVIGASATNTWSTLLGATGTITLRPGATLGVMAGDADAVGYAVTPTTGDLLKVANSGAGSAVSYDIVIIGASA